MCHFGKQDARQQRVGTMGRQAGVRRFAQRISGETRLAQHVFVTRRQYQVVNPVQQQSPGFRAHPLGELVRKPVAGAKGVDAVQQERLGLVTDRPVKPVLPGRSGRRRSSGVGGIYAGVHVPFQDSASPDRSWRHCSQREVSIFTSVVHQPLKPSAVVMTR